MSERLRELRRYTCVAVGVVAVGGVSYGGYELYEAWPRYGEVTTVDGEHAASPPIEEPSIITANAHNELPEKNDDLREEIELENPSIVVLQETNAKAAKSLGMEFPKWSVAYGQADAKRPGGGIGNLILSKTPLRNEQAHKIDEPGLVEDRIVLSAITELVVEGKREEIQILAYHISRHDPYRVEEFGRLLKIVERSRGSADSTIVCGDSNTRPAEIQDRFGKIGFRAVTSPYKTYIGSPQGSIVDSCAYDQRGRIGFRWAFIGKKFRTDHRPVRYTLIKLETAE